jgi:hypothetical protein
MSTSPNRLEPLSQARKSNVIILTSGLSGSSVLAGLIARQTYWTGVDTFKKEYDTFENIDLVNLNKRLIAEAGFSGRYDMEFHQEPLDHVATLDPAVNGTPYRRFLAECGRHEPWIWKDPRLWLTIRYWNHLLDWKHCKAIMLTRDLRHHWVSMTLRRQIQSFAAMKRYETSIERSLLQFADSNGIDLLRLSFEDLIATPEKTLDRLNRHVGCGLTVNDLRAIYRGELYQAPRDSMRDFITAILIYAKNRSERWDLKETNT